MEGTGVTEDFLQEEVKKESQRNERDSMKSKTGTSRFSHQVESEVEDFRVIQPSHNQSLHLAAKEAEGFI